MEVKRNEGRHYLFLSSLTSEHLPDVTGPLPRASPRTRPIPSSCAETLTARSPHTHSVLASGKARYVNFEAAQSYISYISPQLLASTSGCCFLIAE